MILCHLSPLRTYRIYNCGYWRDMAVDYVIQTETSLKNSCAIAVAKVLCFFFFFNWRILLLDSCVGFCNTAEWIILWIRSGTFWGWLQESFEPNLQPNFQIYTGNCMGSKVIFSRYLVIFVCSFIFWLIVNAFWN